MCVNRVSSVRAQARAVRLPVTDRYATYVLKHQTGRALRPRDGRTEL